MITVSRILNSLKTRGIKGSFNRIFTGPQINMFGSDALDFITDRYEIEFNRKDYDQNKNEQTMLNWVIPEMGEGSGGHLNIFRFVTYLEHHGIHNRIYLYRSVKFKTDQEAQDFIHKYFPILDLNVEIYCHVNKMTFAHGIVATSWETAYFVRKFNNVISKFYFVQDYEPYFFAPGSFYAFAENTYDFGFRGITAGDWLKQMCEAHGMKAVSFRFSYDKDIYFPHQKKDNVKRVFFYARPVTPRRDFELGVLALRELKKMVPDLEIVMAGWDLSTYMLPFDFKDLGIQKLEALSEVYGNCDMCFVISATNLSLLPLEVMASGSVPVCTKGENSTWLVNGDNSILVSFDPFEIAQTMKYYFDHPEKLEEKRNAGMAFAQGTSWDENGEIVRKAILEGIEEDNENIDHRR